MTFHGLRHTYAVKKYWELTGSGMSALDAHFAVSQLSGHEWADMTNIYLDHQGQNRKPGYHHCPDALSGPQIAWYL